MPLPGDCYCTGPTITPPVNYPGSAGLSAFAILAASFTVPAVGSTVTVTVNQTQCLVVGQTVIIGQGAGAVLANPGPGTFFVDSIPSDTTVTLEFTGSPGDVTAGSTISSGAVLAAAIAFPSNKRGTATLSAGTVTVTGVKLTANSIILISRNTTGGAAGNLSAPAASRNVGAGSFVISSSSGTETSTIDYLIIG